MNGENVKAVKEILAISDFSLMSGSNQIARIIAPTVEMERVCLDMSVLYPRHFFNWLGNSYSTRISRSNFIYDHIRIIYFITFKRNEMDFCQN